MQPYLHTNQKMIENFCLMQQSKKMVALKGAKIIASIEWPC